MSYDPARYSGVYRISHPHGFLDWRLGTGGIAEIVEIEVQSEYRRTGIGRALLNRLFEELQAAGVGVVYAFTRAENQIAQEWYEAVGFNLDLLPEFYPDGDAVACWRAVRCD